MKLYFTLVLCTNLPDCWSIGTCLHTNQQKLCTKLIHCHVCKSYRVIKISKNPKRIKKKTTMYIYWRSSVKTSDQRACHVIQTYLYKTC